MIRSQRHRISPTPTTPLIWTSACPSTFNQVSSLISFSHFLVDDLISCIDFHAPGASLTLRDFWSTTLSFNTANKYSRGIIYTILPANSTKVMKLRYAQFGCLSLLRVLTDIFHSSVKLSTSQYWAGKDISAFTISTTDQEILFPIGSRFTVQSVISKSNVYFVDLLNVNWVK